MNWTDIQSEWAMMAQRIRADVPCGAAAEGMAAIRLVGSDDPIRTIVGKEAATGNIEITQKRSPLSTP
jgi:hypothetical protein